MKDFVTLPCRVIEFARGAIVKRGRTELSLYGEAAFDLFSLLFEQLATVNALSKVGEELPASVAAKLREILARLVAERIVVPNTSTDCPTGNTFQWALNIGPVQADISMNRPIILVGANAFSFRLRDALLAAGSANLDVLNFPGLDDKTQTFGELRVGEIDPNAFCILCAPNAQTSALRAAHAYLFRHNLDILPVCIRDLKAEIGPWIRRALLSPCYECVRARQNANMDDPERERASENPEVDGDVWATEAPFVFDAVVTFTALQIILAVFGRGFQAHDEIIEFDPVTCTLNRRLVLRVPGCRVCDSTANEVPVPSIHRRSMVIYK
jgi:bacteriocin biosynthesis cyclodehydratase domain-containing protein